MCGISGYFEKQTGAFGAGDPAAILRNMNCALAHRGPDDQDIWFDEEAGIGLAHRRLAILDLSPRGRQPMVSPGGRYVGVYNGEIYNYRQIASEMPDVRFQSGTDTEVLLAACERWGISTALAKCIGMFAFALWDRHENALILARDRLGKKPLYYGWGHNLFVFGSELKAFLQHPRFGARLNRSAVSLFASYSCVPAPHCIYDAAYKLIPGTYLRLSAAELSQRPAGFSGFATDESDGAAPLYYWSPKERITMAREARIKSESEAISLLDQALRDSIRLRLVSDVPVGAFLSGGIDSSCVVALMQQVAEGRVKSFAIGFTEKEYDESSHARDIARHLGCEHHELIVEPQNALDVIAELPRMFDEPFGDSSQIPTYLVSKLARAHVTVALSGDGGDELFGGYNRYAWASRVWDWMDLIPPRGKTFTAAGIRALPPEMWNRLLAPLKRLRATSLSFQNIGEKAHKLASHLSRSTFEDFYLNLVTHWTRSSGLVLKSDALRLAVEDGGVLPAGLDPFERMMFLDLIFYLPDDILTKLDRASMAVGLESRVPLLDHRIVELAWRMPLEFKYRRGRTKHLLREVLAQYVPENLVDRPKMGFGVPVGAWLRGPLRSWADDLLSTDRLERDSIFDVAMVSEKWSQHRSGKRNWDYLLWDVLMFQSWLDEYRGRIAL